MQSSFQLASVHGMLYTGGNIVFSPDGQHLFSPVSNHISAVALQQEGHHTYTCSNSTIQCFDLSPDGDLLIALGQRGVGFFYSLSSRVVLDTISFPPACAISTVKFSPCGRFVAVALETTLQIYNAPAKRVVSFHSCHRVENMHGVLTLPITSVDWTCDGRHLLLAGLDARMKIVPRHVKPHQRRAALQQNMLVGHRSAVIGAWFMQAPSMRHDSTMQEEAVIHDSNSSHINNGDNNNNNNDKDRSDTDEDKDAATRRVISVSVDNVVMLWRRGVVRRAEVMRAIAQARLDARCGAGSTNKKHKKHTQNHEQHEKPHSSSESDEDEEEDEEEGVPLSFLEKQHRQHLQRRGVRVSQRDDSHLPPILRDAYTLEKKFLLKSKGVVSVAAYHKSRHLLALGYDSGIFTIHTPGAAGDAESGTPDELTLLHLLSISSQSLTAVAFSPSGDLVGFGSAHLKQLLVWDWKSEVYALKEQSHYYDITRTAITADASCIISGGDDGKLKVWRVSSGQCLVTFAEHRAPITGLVTSPATHAFFSCSMDGTARGFDLIRYRPFRVFVPPEATQFTCLATDPSAELLAVGSGQCNTIYLFGVQTGRVVDKLHGHSAPISALAIHPAGTALVSGSLDHRLVVWDLFTSASSEGGARLRGDTHEAVELATEVLSVAFSGSGRRMAILTRKQEVTVYDTAVPTAAPELIKTFAVGAEAVGGWRRGSDGSVVGPPSANDDAHFNRLALSPEGERVLLGGESRWLVLFHATQGYVLRAWPITSNLDVQGAEEQFPWRNMTEAGYLDDAADVEDEGGEADVHLRRRGGGGGAHAQLELPGSRRGAFAAAAASASSSKRAALSATGQRCTALTARAADVSFAVTGTEFVAATTGGLLVFALHLGGAGLSSFQPMPMRLTQNTTITRARAQLEQEGQPVLAWMSALVLGEEELAVECMRRLPAEAIPVAVSAAPTVLLPRLIRWVSAEVERARGVEHALLWAQSVLMHGANGALMLAATDYFHHGLGGGGGGSSSYSSPSHAGRGGAHGDTMNSGGVGLAASVMLDVAPALRTMLRALHEHRTLAQLSQQNYFSLQYLADVARMNKNVLTPIAEEEEGTGELHSRTGREKDDNNNNNNINNK